MINATDVQRKTIHCYLYCIILMQPWLLHHHALTTISAYLFLDIISAKTTAAVAFALLQGTIAYCQQSTTDHSSVLAITRIQCTAPSQPYYQHLQLKLQALHIRPVMSNQTKVYSESIEAYVVLVFSLLPPPSSAFQVLRTGSFIPILRISY